MKGASWMLYRTSSLQIGRSEVSRTIVELHQSHKHSIQCTALGNTLHCILKWSVLWVYYRGLPVCLGAERGRHQPPSRRAFHQSGLWAALAAVPPAGSKPSGLQTRPAAQSTRAGDSLGRRSPPIASFRTKSFTALSVFDSEHGMIYFIELKTVQCCLTSCSTSVFVASFARALLTRTKSKPEQLGEVW